MAKRWVQKIRTGLAALLLLPVLLVGGELWLMLREPLQPPMICPRVPSEWNELLVESTTAHHTTTRLHKSITSASNAPLYTTDAFGLRVDPAVPPAEATPNTFRVLILGDETIAGPHVRAEESVPERLRQFLKRLGQDSVTVLNGGVPGDCPLLSVLRMEHEFAALRPDLVILHVDMNDIADDAYYRRYVVGNDDQFICRHPGLTGANDSSTVGMATTLKRTATGRWIFRQLADQASAAGPASDLEDRYGWLRDPAPDWKLPVRHALQPLNRLAILSEELGFRLVLATCPTVWQVRGSDPDPALSERYRMGDLPTGAIGQAGPPPGVSDLPLQILQAWAGEKNVRLVDATQDFRKETDTARLFSRNYPLPSGYGSAVYARSLALGIRPLLPTPTASPNDRLTRRGPSAQNQ